MPFALKVFVGALLGGLLYEAINYALAPEAFDVAEEALEAVVIAVVVTAVVQLFTRWRGRRTEPAREAD